MDDALTRLDALLSEESVALSAGDFDTLLRLGTQKEAIADALVDQRVAPEALDAIRHRLERHSHRLKAAESGLRDVIERLAAQRQARTQLQTYDSSGQSAQIAAAPPRTQRRY